MAFLKTRLDEQGLNHPGDERLHSFSSFFNSLYTVVFPYLFAAVSYLMNEYENVFRLYKYPYCQVPDSLPFTYLDQVDFFFVTMYGFHGIQN